MPHAIPVRHMGKRYHAPFKIILELLNFTRKQSPKLPHHFPPLDREIIIQC